jgi:cyclopropane fatty-acyl-phospholipid synthase-like methyltransferase
MVNFGKEDRNYLGGYIIGGDHATFCTETWDWMINNNIKSVIDVGCGEGHSTKYFYDKGCEVLGIEGGKNAISNSPIKEKIILHDYTESPYTPNKTYDAVWCCEFVEHVEEKYIDNFLTTFDYSNNIFLTHAIPGQGGYHHVNEQNSDYWIDKITTRGFNFNKDLALYLRNITKCRWIQSLLVFEKIL